MCIMYWLKIKMIGGEEKMVTRAEFDKVFFVPIYSSSLGVIYEKFYFDQNINLLQLVDLIKILINTSMNFESRLSKLIKSGNIKNEFSISFKSLDSLLNIYHHEIVKKNPKYNQIINIFAADNKYVYYSSERLANYEWIFKYNLFHDINNVNISVNYLTARDEIRIIVDATAKLLLYDNEFGYDREIIQTVKSYRQFILNINAIRNRSDNDDKDKSISKHVKNVLHHIANLFLEPVIFLPVNLSNKFEQMLYLNDKPLKSCMKLFYAPYINYKPVYSKNKKDLLLTEHVNELLGFTKLSTRLEYLDNMDIFSKIKDKISEVLKLLMYDTCYSATINITDFNLLSS